MVEVAKHDISVPALHSAQEISISVLPPKSCSDRKGNPHRIG
jgi:hypothetical protein